MQSKIYDRHRELMDDVVNNYLQCGVAVLVDDRTEEEKSFVSFALLRSMLRAIAKEKSRPFVWAYSVTWRGSRYSMVNGQYKRIYDKDPSYALSLHIPKVSRLDVLRSPLLIGADEYRPGNFDNPLTVQHKSSESTFHFKGDGIAVFDAFIERCKTDYVHRAALNL